MQYKRTPYCFSTPSVLRIMSRADLTNSLTRRDILCVAGPFRPLDPIKLGKHPRPTKN